MNSTMDASEPTPESATAPTPEPAAVAPPPILFRASRKKRAVRQRAEEDDDAKSATQTDAAVTINTGSEATAAGLQDATRTTEPAVSGTVATAPKRDENDKEEGSGLSVAEVLRLRNAKKHRLGGVAFRAGDEAGVATTVQNSEQAMVLHDGGEVQQQEAAILGGVAKRFAPQTGMVGELVNKHIIRAS